MKNSSPKPGLIDADEAVVSAWQPPSVQIPTAREQAEQERERLVTAQSIEALQKKAYQEGRTQGFERGLKDGMAEAAQRVARLDSIIRVLQRPLDEMDEAVVEQLSNLSMSIAKMLIRRELKTDPGQIVAVVRETVSALPAGAENIRIHLGPDDARLLREAMSLSDGEQSWEIIEDPLLSPGGCKVLTDTSEVDASVESRLNAIIAQAFGGERRGDRSPED